MTDKRYYYLKLEETYFNNKIEKALRCMPSGAEMLICYLKMQLKYIASEGFITYSGIYENIEDEIALEIDESKDIVKMTMIALNKWGYVEQIENGFYLADVQKRIGSKLDSAIRVAKHRELKALQCNKKVTQYRVREELESDKELELESDKLHAQCHTVTTQEVWYKSTPIPCIGGTWSIPESLASQILITYEHIDLESELKKMALWAISNPQKRKTMKGMPRFVSGWIEREQNKPKHYTQSTDKSRTAYERQSALFGGDEPFLPAKNKELE